MAKSPSFFLGETNEMDDADVLVVRQMCNLAYRGCLGDRELFSYVLWLSAHIDKAQLQLVLAIVLGQLKNFGREALAKQCCNAKAPSDDAETMVRYAAKYFMKCRTDEERAAAIDELNRFITYKTNKPSGPLDKAIVSS